MKPPTLEEHLQQEIVSLQQRADLVQTAITQLHTDYPDLLATPMNVTDVFADAWGRGDPPHASIQVSVYKHDHAKDHSLMDALLDARDPSGPEALTALTPVDRGSLYSSIEATTGLIEFSYKWRTPPGMIKCHKARVVQTRIIEVCGDLDTTKYDSVEWLDDDA